MHFHRYSRISLSGILYWRVTYTDMMRFLGALCLEMSFGHACNPSYLPGLMASKRG
jgi:hypothetical protein